MPRCYKLKMWIDYEGYYLGRYDIATMTWSLIKTYCEGDGCDSDNKIPLLKRVKRECKMVDNKNLSILNRHEGGLGGDDNRLHRQIRFRRKNPSYNDIEDECVMLTATDGSAPHGEKWTLDLLQDLLNAFVKVIDGMLPKDAKLGNSMEIVM